MRAFPLLKEVAAQGDESNDDRRCLRVITRDRDCKEFTPWQQGFSPKEHREMLDRNWLLEWQRKTQLEDREWRERQAREDQEWKEREAAAASKRHRQELWIMGGIVTAVTLIVQIIIAYTTAK